MYGLMSAGLKVEFPETKDVTEAKVGWVLSLRRFRVWIGPIRYVAERLHEMGIRTVIIGFFDVTLFNSNAVRNPDLLSLAEPYLHMFGYHKSRGAVLSRLYKPISIKRIQKFLSRHGFHAIITNYYHPGLPEGARLADAKSILWCTEDPMYLSNSWFDYARKFNHVFTISLGAVEAYRQAGVLNIEWLPLCFEPRYFYPRRVTKKVYPITFVGNRWADITHGFRNLLEPLVKKYGRQIHIFGRGWGPEVGGTAHGPVSWYKVPEIYSSSQIVLGFHRDPQYVAYGTLTARVFEALGTRSFFLSDHPAGLEELFQPGHDLVTARDGKEAIELAESYLEDEEARERIAARGYEKTWQRHTTIHRAKVFASIIKKGL